MMESNLCLFFTLGLSMKEWDKNGSLRREIALYNKFSSSFKKIYFFTYGGEEELKYKNLLNDNIEIVTNKYNLNKYLYSFLMPFIHLDIILGSMIFKTNQIIGSWSALISKILSPKSFFILRSGYTPSLLEKVNGNTKKYKIFRLLEKVMYKVCDFSIVTSNESLQYARSYIKKENIHLIHNYVDTEIFKPIETKKNGRILFVGRIDKIKNLKNLILSLDRTCIGLDIVGEGNKEYKNYLKNLVNERNIDVRFLGTKNSMELPKIINSYELFILPSIREGMPKVLIEAMACGVPCIGTNVPGIREVIFDNINGILCGTSSKEIHNAIIKTIDDKSKKCTLGKNAKNTIDMFYSLDIIKDIEISLYNVLKDEV